MGVADDLQQDEWSRFGVSLGGMSTAGAARPSLDGGRKVARPPSLQNIHSSMEQVRLRPGCSFLFVGSRRGGGWVDGARVGHGRAGQVAYVGLCAGWVAGSVIVSGRRGWATKQLALPRLTPTIWPPFPLDR